MIGPVVHGAPVLSKVMLVGQAPGVHEGDLAKPFAWTAGKRLFQWLSSVGGDEEWTREQVYISAVCRCFPGKAKAGDRVPSRDEIANCSTWLGGELELMKPELVIPIGKLAIEWFLPQRPLVEQIGVVHKAAREKLNFDVIPLPHPSGASTWFRMEPGKTLTTQALKKISNHPAWKALTRDLSRA